MSRWLLVHTYWSWSWQCLVQHDQGARTSLRSRGTKHKHKLKHRAKDIVVREKASEEKFAFACRPQQGKMSSQIRLRDASKENKMTNHSPQGATLAPIGLGNGNKNTHGVELCELKGPRVKSRRKQTQSALFQACKAGDLALVRAWVQGRNNMKTDETDRTALHVAARYGNLEVCDELIRFGFDINALDKDGFSPLHRAARAGKVRTCEFLCSRAANANIVDSKRIQSPIFCAAERDFAEVCKQLVVGGADPNLESRNGKTPLHRAAEKGHESVLRTLNECGADLERTTIDNKRTALHLAAAQGHLGACQALIELGGNVHALDKFERTALHLAAVGGHFEVVKLFISLNLDLNVRDLNQNTPLHLASENGNTQTCMVLLENGAHANAKNKLGNTPIHRAAMNGHPMVLLSLLQFNGDIRAKNKRNATPLHCSAMNGHPELCRLLCEKACEVDARDYCQSTPLHWAAAHGHTDTCNQLVELGANVDAMDYKMQTPFQWAAMQNHVSVCRELIKLGAQPPATLVAPSQQGRKFSFRTSESHEGDERDDSHSIHVHKANAKLVSQNVEHVVSPKTGNLQLPPLGRSK